MFVKICGITNESDALFAVAMGADALGFVFAPSPRQVAPTLVRDIVRRIPSEVVTIGVFRDDATKRVVDIAHSCGLDGVQLHGHETPAECAWVRERVGLLIKAFPAGDQLVERVADYGIADAWLLDAPKPGSGTTFDWSIVDALPGGHRLIVAGGLHPDNVGAAIERTGAWGVDSSTGVESAPGHKDARKVYRFCRNAKRYPAPVHEGDHLLMPLDFDFADYGEGLIDLATLGEIDSFAESGEFDPPSSVEHDPPFPDEGHGQPPVSEPTDNRSATSRREAGSPVSSVPFDR